MTCQHCHAQFLYVLKPVFFATGLRQGKKLHSSRDRYASSSRGHVNFGQILYTSSMKLLHLRDTKNDFHLTDELFECYALRIA